MKEDDLGTDWQLMAGPLMQLLVELTGSGWCWGIVRDTSAASPEREVEAEEAEGPSAPALALALVSVPDPNRIETKELPY